MKDKIINKKSVSQNNFIKILLILFFLLFLKGYISKYELIKIINFNFVSKIFEELQNQTKKNLIVILLIIKKI